MCWVHKCFDKEKDNVVKYLDESAMSIFFITSVLVCLSPFQKLESKYTKKNSSVLWVLETFIAVIMLYMSLFLLFDHPLTTLFLKFLTVLMMFYFLLFLTNWMSHKDFVGPLGYIYQTYLIFGSIFAILIILASSLLKPIKKIVHYLYLFTLFLIFTILCISLSLGFMSIVYLFLLFLICLYSEALIYRKFINIFCFFLYLYILITFRLIMRQSIQIPNQEKFIVFSNVFFVSLIGALQVSIDQFISYKINIPDFLNGILCILLVVVLLYVIYSRSQTKQIVMTK